MSQQIDDEFEDVPAPVGTRFNGTEHDLDAEDLHYDEIPESDFQDEEPLEEDAGDYDVEIAAAAGAAVGAAVGAAGMSAMADDDAPKKGLFGKLMGGRKKSQPPPLSADTEDAPPRRKKKTPVAVYATLGVVGVVLVGAFVGQDYVTGLIKGGTPQAAMPAGKALPNGIGQQAGMPQGKPLPAGMGQPDVLPPVDDAAALDPFAAPPMSGSSGFESVTSVPGSVNGAGASRPIGVGPLSPGDAVGNLDPGLLSAQGGTAIPQPGVDQDFAAAVQMDPFAPQGSGPVDAMPMGAANPSPMPVMPLASAQGAPAVVDAARVDVINAAAVDLDAAIARINGNVDGLRGDVIAGFDGQKVALGEIAASLNKLGSTLEEIKTNTAKPAAKAAQQAPKKPAPQAAKKPAQPAAAKAPAKTVDAKPMIAPEKKPALAQAQANLQASAGKSPQFVVRAATRGKAWISSSSAGTDLREIASGATLDGWGKVMTIRQTVGGKWEIVTERGIAGVSS